MVSRRTVLALLATLPVAGSRLARQAAADPTAAAPRPAPPRVAWWQGEAVAKAGPGTISAERSGRHTAAKLLTQLVPTSVDLIARDNASTEFSMWVVFPRQPADHDVLLSADGSWWQSESDGHDDGASQASFTFDRPTAERLARALGLPLHERHRLDDGLKTTWKIPARASTRPTDPITIQLRVRNGGKTKIGFVIGGRQRGPRDNRFVFTVTRNGKPVALKDAPDFGGLSYHKPLAPGEAAELSVDLRAWADLSTPGHYAIDVAYEGELARDGYSPSTPAEQANVWDIRLSGQGAILVQ